MKYPEPESSTLEFKERIPSRDQILKTVVAFCNSFGGRIILGVEDSGSVAGIEEGEVDRLLEYFDKSIYECCSPPIIPEVYTQRMYDRLLLVIKVSAGMQKPYFIRSEGISDGTYVRLGRSTMRADAGTIEELHRQSRRISYDSTPVYHGRHDDIDAKAFADFRKSKRVGAGSNAIAGGLIRALESYHLLVEEQSRRFPTVSGLLLFNPEPQKWFPEAFIICSVFSGRTGRQALATRDFSGSLFSQLEGAYDFIGGSLKKSFVIQGKRRRESHEIPMVAVREALLNAIVHRNYALPAPIKIAIYEDRIEFFSPGSFPGPFNVQNLTSGITYIRNTAITKVFREAGYIEKLGTGFITMLEAYRSMGLKSPSVIDGENYVKCILPRERAEAETDPEIGAILGLFYRMESISVQDVMNHTGLSRSTAGRRLKELENRRSIHKKGRGPMTRYHLGGAA